MVEAVRWTAVRCGQQVGGSNKTGLTIRHGYQQDRKLYYVGNSKLRHMRGGKLRVDVRQEAVLCGQQQGDHMRGGKLRVAVRQEDAKW